MSKTMRIQNAYIHKIDEDTLKSLWDQRVALDAFRDFDYIVYSGTAVAIGWRNKEKEAGKAQNLHIYILWTKNDRKLNADICILLKDIVAYWDILLNKEYREEAAEKFTNLEFTPLSEINVEKALVKNKDITYYYIDTVYERLDNRELLSSIRDAGVERKVGTTFTEADVSKAEVIDDAPIDDMSDVYVGIRGKELVQIVYHNDEEMCPEY